MDEPALYRPEMPKGSMRMDLRTELKEAAELSLSGVAERTVETCVVGVFRSTGWSLRQIEQDVPVSDRAVDRADIAIRIGDRPFLVAEVKRYGQIREGQLSIRRYCALVRPKFAVVTDGVRWIFYYAGQSDLFELLDRTVPEDLADVVTILSALGPANVDALVDAGAFAYLDTIVRALSELSEDARKPLSPHFAMTVATTLGHGSQIRPRRGGGQSGDDGHEVPDLRHTSISRACFGEDSVSSWTALVYAAIRHALTVSGRSLADLRQIVGAQIVEGELNDRGFRPVAGTSVSVQGMEARRAWRDALAVARDTNTRVLVEFMWQKDTGAAKSGEVATLEWNPEGQ